MPPFNSGLNVLTQGFQIFKPPNTGRVRTIWNAQGTPWNHFGKPVNRDHMKQIMNFALCVASNILQRESAEYLIS